MSIDREQIFESVGASNFISLIDLNERAIRFTDDLIMELNDFMKEFPDIGKSLVNTKKLKRYGTILTFSSNENPTLIDIIKKSPEVDYEILSELFGRPAEEIRKEYRSVYEKH